MTSAELLGILLYLGLMGGYLAVMAITILRAEYKVRKRREALRKGLRSTSLSHPMGPGVLIANLRDFTAGDVRKALEEGDD